MDTSSRRIDPGEDRSSSSSHSPPSPPELMNQYRTRGDTSNDERNPSGTESSATNHINTTLSTARSSSSPISTTTTSTVSTPSTAATSLTSTTTTSTNTSYSTPPSATTAAGAVNTPTRDMLLNQNGNLGSNNNNNNNHISSNSHNNQAAVMMERVVFQLHYRMCCMISYWIPASVRVFLEYLLLVLSILGFSALVLLHKSFVYTDPSNNNMAMTCFHDIIHQTIITPFNSTTTTPATTIDLLYIKIIKDDHVSVGDDDDDRTDYLKTKMKILQTTPKHIEGDTIQMMMASNNNEHQQCSTEHPQQQQQQETCSYHRHHHHQEDSYDYQYAFSTTQAYLLLPPDHVWLKQPQPQQNHRIQHRHHHHNHNLTIVHVAVSSKDPNCFGEPFLQSLLWNCWIDLDILVQNWCLGMLSQLQQHERKQQQITSATPPTTTTNSIGYLWKSNQQGHLQELVVSAGDRFGGGGTVSRSSSSRHRRSRPTYEQKHQHQQRTDKSVVEDQYTTILRVIVHWVMGKIGRWIQITCLFFFCTTLVSFTLTETQERMLWFTHELRRRVQSNVPVQTLVVGHLIQTFVFVPIMVGMIFFLMECYQGDKVLAFLQLSIVWCVEVFSVISLRSYQGMTFFPKIFFLLFCLFHVYHFANPYGFGYTALAVIGCFIVHSMFFFWNRFELPAVALELVTVDRPRRLIGGGTTLSTTTISTITTSSASPASSSGFLSSTSPLFGEGGRQRDQHWQQQQQQHTDPATEASEPITPPIMTGGTIVTTTMQTPLRNNSSRSSLPSATNASAIFRNPSPLRGSGPTGGGEPTLLFGSYASLSSSSQHTGSGVFRAGAGTDDDDEDSYVYFMEGEVVLRRNRPPRAGSTSNTTNTTTSHATVNPVVGGTISLEGTLSNNAHMSGNILNRNNKPSNGSTIGLNVDDDDDDEATQNSKEDNTPPIHPMAMNRNGVSSSTTAAAPTTTTPYSDESGGLQAILEVRLTPRHRHQTNSTSSNPNVNDPHSDGVSIGTNMNTTASTTDSTDRSPPPPNFPILR